MSSGKFERLWTKSNTGKSIYQDSVMFFLGCKVFDVDRNLFESRVDKLLRDLVIPNGRLGNFKWPSGNVETPENVCHVTD